MPWWRFASKMHGLRFSAWENDGKRHPIPIHGETHKKPGGFIGHLWLPGVQMCPISQDYGEYTGSEGDSFGELKCLGFMVSPPEILR